MKFGRSLRDNAARSTAGHIYDAWLIVMNVQGWPWGAMWRDISSGLSALANLALFILAFASFPVPVPVAGICRKVNAVRRYKRELKFYGQDSTI